MPGELVCDPFGGLFSTNYMAMKLGRKSKAIELNSDYFKDGAFYLNSMHHKVNSPTLFDLLEV